MSQLDAELHLTNKKRGKVHKCIALPTDEDTVANLTRLLLLLVSKPKVLAVPMTINEAMFFILL